MLELINICLKMNLDPLECEEDFHLLQKTDHTAALTPLETQAVLRLWRSNCIQTAFNNRHHYYVPGTFSFYYFFYIFLLFFILHYYFLYFIIIFYIYSFLYYKDSAPYYFENVERIGAPGFEPTEEDIVMSRVRTTGMIVNNFNVPPLRYKVVDVG